MSVQLAKKTTKTRALIIEVDTAGLATVSDDNNVINANGESEVSSKSEVSGESNLGEEEPMINFKGKGLSSNACTTPPMSGMEGLGGPSMSSGSGAVEGQDALVSLVELINSRALSPAALSEWARGAASQRHKASPRCHSSSHLPSQV